MSPRTEFVHVSDKYFTPAPPATSFEEQAAVLAEPITIPSDNESEFVPSDEEDRTMPASRISCESCLMKHRACNGRRPRCGTCSKFRVRYCVWPKKAITRAELLASKEGGEGMNVADEQGVKRKRSGEETMVSMDIGEELEVAKEQSPKKKSPGGERVARNRRVIGRTREEAREGKSVAEAEAEVEDEGYLAALGELSIDSSHNRLAKPALGEDGVVTFTDEPPIAMPWNTREQNNAALQELQAGVLPPQTQHLFETTARLVHDNGGLMSNVLGRDPRWDTLGLDLNWSRQPNRLGDGSWNPIISADHADAFVDINTPLPSAQQAGAPGPTANPPKDPQQTHQLELPEPDTSLKKLDADEANVAQELEQDGWGPDPGYFEEAFNAIMAAREYEGGYDLYEPISLDDDEEY